MCTSKAIARPRSGHKSPYFHNNFPAKFYLCDCVHSARFTNDRENVLYEINAVAGTGRWIFDRKIAERGAVLLLATIFYRLRHSCGNRWKTQIFSNNRISFSSAPRGCIASNIFIIVHSLLSHTIENGMRILALSKRLKRG